MGQRNQSCSDSAETHILISKFMNFNEKFFHESKDYSEISRLLKFTQILIKPRPALPLPNVTPPPRETENQGI